MLQPFQLPKALHSNQSTQHLEHVMLPIASNTCRTQVAHRDLKSANVLYDRQLTIKLCDFAFSKLKVPALTCSSSSLPLTSPIYRSTAPLSPVSPVNRAVLLLFAQGGISRCQGPTTHFTAMHRPVTMSVSTQCPQWTRRIPPASTPHHPRPRVNPMNAVV